MKTGNKILILSVGISTLLVYLAGAFVNWDFNYLSELSNLDRGAIIGMWVLFTLLVIAITNATE